MQKLWRVKVFPRYKFKNNFFHIGIHSFRRWTLSNNGNFEFVVHLEMPTLCKIKYYEGGKIKTIHSSWCALIESKLLVGRIFTCRQMKIFNFSIWRGEFFWHFFCEFLKWNHDLRKVPKTFCVLLMVDDTLCML